MPETARVTFKFGMLTPSTSITTWRWTIGSWDKGKYREWWSLVLGDAFTNPHLISIVTVRAQKFHLGRKFNKLKSCIIRIWDRIDNEKWLRYREPLGFRRWLKIVPAYYHSSRYQSSKTRTQRSTSGGSYNWHVNRLQVAFRLSLPSWIHAFNLRLRYEYTFWFLRPID